MPIDKTCDLLRFDKRVLIDIPKREPGSRCHFEDGDSMTVNLADEIIRGKRTWQEALYIGRTTRPDLRSAQHLVRGGDAGWRLKRAHAQAEARDASISYEILEAGPGLGGGEAG